MESPIHPTPALINTVSFETKFGFRTINLIAGDVLQSTDDLLVVSSHAIPGTDVSGEVISSLIFDHDVYLGDLNPLITVGQDRGAYEVNAGVSHWKNILVIRIPGTAFDDDAIEDATKEYRQGIWSLFGSIAALELRGECYTSMAMPLLGGARGYDYRFLAECLINNAKNWLLSSQHMHTVNAYILDPEAEARWDAAINDLLERTEVSAIKGSAIRALCDEIIGQLGSQDFRYDEQLGKASLQIAGVIKRKTINLQQLALASRKLTERLVQLICPLVGIDIQKGLEADINRIANTKRVAPWIASHFHTLRILGNRSAHTTDEILHIPKDLEDEDLLVLLVALSRAVAFWKQRREISAS